MTAPPARPVPLWRYAAITAIVLVTVGVAMLAVQARAILVLIFLSFLLAAGLDPLVRRLQRLVRRRGFAVAILVIGLILVLTGLSAGAFVPAARQFAAFVQAVPNLVQDIAHQVGSRDTRLGRYLSEPAVQQAIHDALGRLPALLSSGVGALFGLIGKIFGAVFSVLTVGALTVYFMLALPRIVATLGALLGSAERSAVLDEALAKIGGYITGQLVICVAAGASAYVFFLIVGVPYPALIALGVAILDLVPQIGASLGAVLGAAMALTVSIGVALGTIAFFIAYQQLENYVLAPRILARATALSPLTAFIAALIGGSAAGIVGAVAALPVTAALQVVVRHALRDRFPGPPAPQPDDTPPEPDESAAPEDA
ncbi:AI-2E family transporter [Actinocatenispora thailandica]|uniref:AI-2E family transporter n=1 Tax=Actinocatenispora thailandica TaxID=227318 RepID=A0A7R7DQW9_9ACTN|nr:AI-2E family transporter [Actinocatenispora thailandica]BCJ36220.1 AI-2E family transporter [Actinocatenispora thailandica]